jgi:hypothetical protein
MSSSKKNKKYMDRAFPGLDKVLIEKVQPIGSSGINPEVMGLSVGKKPEVRRNTKDIIIGKTYKEIMNDMGLPGDPPEWNPYARGAWKIDRLSSHDFEREYLNKPVPTDEDEGGKKRGPKH